MKFKAGILFICAIAFSLHTYAVNGGGGNKDEQKDNTEPEIDTAVTFVEDDPILAMLDSMYTMKFFSASDFTTDTSMLNVYNFPTDSIPVFDDFVYEYRLKKLDNETPFSLVYNDPVKRYIHAYGVQNREKVSRVLGLAEYYFPLFEETMDRYQLPLEFKYLAIVESALNPYARSRSGAVGLWQFMYRTGKIYNLHITSYYDDRRDPFKATIAACEYFQYLYKMFGNWELVLAAYNGGPGTVNKAIRRSGGKMDYWAIRPYLPRETQGYVPAFIAVNYIMNYASEHNIYPEKPVFFSYEVDTIKVKNRVTFQTLSEVLEISKDELQFLNPIYRHNVIPYNKDYNTLVLPRQKMGVFLANEEEIYKLQELKEMPSFASSKYVKTEVKQIHSVRSGESLGSIAGRYKCSVRDLRDWNGLRGNIIHPGQKLVVYMEAQQQKSTTSGSSASSVSNSSSGGDKYHVVQRGDTLWDIAKRNGITVSELKRLNDIRDDRGLKPGTKIKIG